MKGANGWKIDRESLRYKKVLVKGWTKWRPLKDVHPESVMDKRRHLDAGFTHVRVSLVGAFRENQFRPARCRKNLAPWS